jgi:hypothetical protein
MFNNYFDVKIANFNEIFVLKMTEFTKSFIIKNEVLKIVVLSKTKRQSCR